MSVSGRTLFEILTGRNKRDMTPLELQYHNPLRARIDQTITFDHEEGLTGINFVVERIVVYKTVVTAGGKTKDFFHTDYVLKGVTLGMDKPIRLRLRLLPDEDSMNDLGCKLQLLTLYHEEPHNDDLVCYLNRPEYFVEGNDSGEPDDICFCINHDPEGNDLDEPQMFWRVDGFDSNGNLVLDQAYEANVTVLVDDDGDGTIENDELEHYNVEYWDYHRQYTDPDSQRETIEYLHAEVDSDTGNITMYRGTEVHADQIFII